MIATSTTVAKPQNPLGSVLSFILRSFNIVIYIFGSNGFTWGNIAKPTFITWNSKKGETPSVKSYETFLSHNDSRGLYKNPLKRSEPNHLTKCVCVREKKGEGVCVHACVCETVHILSKETAQKG